MTKRLISEVLEWYDYNGRDFPWREKNRTPYEILVAEVLLQKTRAESVAKVYLEFLKDFPKIEDLNSANKSDIKSHLSKLGLQERRAEWLKNIADKITKSGGQIPNNEKELKNLPGIGLYIGNAILCFGFNQRKPILDANTSRVIGRVYSVNYEVDLRRNHKLKEKAKLMLPDMEIKKFNWALLDIGSLLCKRDFPNCSECPLKEKCNFYNDTNVTVVPLDEYSFRKTIDENFYAFPASRNLKIHEYLALYKTKPTSAITHLGKVDEVSEKGEIDSKYKLMTFGDKLEEKAKVVDLKALKEIETPIHYDKRTGIQGPTYTSLKNLKKAEDIRDL